MKKLKILQQWPLSKVELVEIKGKKFILKTIHEDFINEIYRQKILRKTCKKIKIPKIYWIKKSNGKVSFLMEYISHKPDSLNKKILFDVLLKFHEETKNLRSKYFKTYNFEAFYKNFLTVKKYLNSSFKNKDKADIKEFFSPVFNSPYSIVHGDWNKDGIFSKNGKYFTIDFAKSYYGPSILDFGNSKIPNNTLNLKTKLVSVIINLAWFDLCKRKYIKYSYKKEISKKVKEFNKIFKEIK